jgi:hypothetical protein
MHSNTGTRLFALRSILLTHSGIFSAITMWSGMVISALHMAFSITIAILATTCPARSIREKAGENWTKLEELIESQGSLELKIATVILFIERCMRILCSVVEQIGRFSGIRKKMSTLFDEIPDVEGFLHTVWGAASLLL